MVGLTAHSQTFKNAQKWLAGDFNGDGRDDLASVSSEHSQASIDVQISTNGGFAYQRWATKQGGFWDDFDRKAS